MATKEQFKVHAVCPISNYGGYELQVSEDGRTARVRINNGDSVSRSSGWLRIKADVEGELFLVYHGNKLYLSNFQRV